jgi:PhnB protein
MITPYLTFYGECEKALAFYQHAFQSEVKTSRPYEGYVPEGVAPPPENLETWILHAEMAICGTNVWFADDPQPVNKGNMIRLTASVATAKEAKAIFEALCDGGNVTLPPVEAFYSAFHAAVTDQFGVNWNIVAEETPAQA